MARMNSSRGLFVVIGLLIALLLSGIAYFLWAVPKSSVVAPASPTAANVPVPLPLPSTVISASTPSTAPQANTAAPSYGYNAQGQIQLIRYPDGTVYTYQYNANGDKIRETTRTGRTWTYVYDQNHHPITIIDPYGRATYQEAPPSPTNPN